MCIVGIFLFFYYLWLLFNAYFHFWSRLNVLVEWNFHYEYTNAIDQIWHQQNNVIELMTSLAFKCNLHENCNNYVFAVILVSTG